MANEMTTRQTGSTLPAPLSKELQIIRNSPKRYLDGLRPEKISDPRPPDAPSLSQIQRVNGFGNAVAVLTLAINEVKEWFNVKNNLTPDQAALTAELILDNPNFYDLTLGNIKACFRHQMMNAKLYDRLDGNIIMQWLRDFKAEMASYCENVNLGADRDREKKESGEVGEIVYLTYEAMLQSRIEAGDREAAKELERYRKVRPRHITEEERQAKEKAFREYKQEYLKKQKL